MRFLFRVKLAIPLLLVITPLSVEGWRFSSTVESTGTRCREHVTPSMQRRKSLQHQQGSSLSATNNISKGDNEHSVGSVVRIAAREFAGKDSRPAGRNYTTRKVSQESIRVLQSGVVLDYNHYRTVALDKTPDRALSILTVDCMELLESYKYPVLDGDLGENVLVKGVNYRFFCPGEKYKFSLQNADDPNDNRGVVVEITEAMEPCANLCKLDYINDLTKPPVDRIETCKEFLNILDQHPGLRGWYAKILQEGTIDLHTNVHKL
jgi:MOSC domain-containing protein YiiM